MVWTFIVLGTFPLDLRHAEPFCMEHGPPQGTGRDTAIQCADACVQGGEVQCFAFAKMPCLMGEMPGFASKAVMNFKIPGIIHRHGPVGRQTPV